MKQIVFAFLITAVLGVGGVALTFAFRSPDASPKPFSSQGLDQQQIEFVEKGRFIYTISCMTCHGVNGDGDSVTPEYLSIRPRDFTGKSHNTQQVMFKFKSLNKTDPLALDKDLKKTIREGLPGTPMPGFPNLSDEEIYALLAYIKTFAYDEWRLNQPTFPALQAPPVPQDLASQGRIDAGRALFTSRGCIACHGDIEQGGTALQGLIDDWGHPSVPRNFALEPLRRPDPQDMFKTIRLGIGGTAMPANALSDVETWDLIAYALHLRSNGQ